MYFLRPIGYSSSCGLFKSMGILPGFNEYYKAVESSILTRYLVYKVQRDFIKKLWTIIAPEDIWRV